MVNSDYYLVIEKMIRMGDVDELELEHLLKSLEERELITAAERQSLLELAQGLRQSSV